MVDDLLTLLKAQTFAGISAAAMFAEAVPAGVPLPFLLLEGLEGTDHLNTLDGGGGLELADVDIVAKCATPSAAKAIIKLIKAFIRDYVGAMGAATCKAVLLRDEYPAKEDPTANGPQRFTYTLSLNVQYIPG